MNEVGIVTLPTGPLETNCLIIHNSSHATIVDPGMGAAPLIRGVLADHGLEVEQIVLTHGHIDHIRDLPEIHQEYRVPVYMHSADLPWLTREVLDAMGPLGDMHDTAAMATPDVPRPIADGDHLTIAGVRFTAHHMPGHSPGSVMFRSAMDLCGNGAAIIGGDVLFPGGAGRTDLPLSDPQAMMDSLRRIPQIFLGTDVVFPGHGPTTTIAKEVRDNPFLQSVR